MLEETNKYCLWRKTKAIPVTVMSHNHPVRIDRRQPLARPGPKMSPARCICPIHVIDLTSRISIDRSAARRTWCAHWLSDLGACVIMSSHHRPNYKSQDKSSVSPTKKRSLLSTWLLSLYKKLCTVFPLWNTTFINLFTNR